jgi:hypothetical protein
VEPWHVDLTASAGEVLCSSGVARPERLFDDGDPGGAAGVDLRPGDTVGWRFPSPTAVSDLTVTVLGDTSASALRWEVVGSDGSWAPAPLTHAAALPSDRTTPFTLAARTVTPAVRLRAEAAVTIRQIELFDLG